ncbi:MAG: hypothetical protein Fur002_23220 [Anaerolineales bacterium]
MNLHRLAKKFLDTPPRGIYYELRAKWFKAQALPAFDDLRPAVFVLSTGRVGTETLDALLQLAENLFSYHEPTPTLYRLSKAAYQHETNPLAKEILTQSFLAARQDLLDYSLKGGKGYAETSPQVTFLAPVIAEALPQARFIHLVRDPRDVVRSGMRRKWYAGHSYDATRITPRPQDSAASLWGAYAPFEKNLWLWNETNRWILSFMENLAAAQKITLRAEDLFAGKESVLAQLYQFVAAPTPSASALKKILGKKLNAQRSGDFPAAAGWTDEQAQSLQEMTGKTARALGYSLEEPRPA